MAPRSTREFLELMQVRTALEIFCLEQGMDSYTEQDVRELESMIDRAAESLESNNKLIAQEIHFDFHLFIVRKLGNQSMVAIYENNRKKLKRYLRANIDQKGERILLSLIRKRDNDRK